MNEQFDFLVIGSGIAGIAFALEAAEKGKVCLVTKLRVEDTNTSYAQGGIATVQNEPDTLEKHIEDTLICGDGICNPSVVRFVIEQSPTAINWLLKQGVEFDKQANGKFDQVKEGGHSEARVFHHKDNTGWEIQRALTIRLKNHPSITLLEHHFAIDLITQHHLGELVKRYYDNIECYGAYVLDQKLNQIKTILAKTTFIATGGIGNLYHTTTNPVTATGDGIAMVYRAKGIIEDMEFVQFHPTSLYIPGERPSFLITEAMRGAGAILKTQKGKEFMHNYDKRASLAPRDIVARAIDNEMKMSGDEYVFLDCTSIGKKTLVEHFPNIYEKCLSVGIDISQQMVPVVPAAHFICGGIKTDMNGQSNIKRLYAAGETACSGLHGANRLASNSLLEGVVFGRRAAQHASDHFSSFSIPSGIPVWNDEGTTHNEEMVLITQNLKELQQIMSNYVGIVRSDLRLNRAMVRLEIIFNETEELYRKSKVSQMLCELRNLINVGYLVIKMAQQRNTSVGLHYNIDHPKNKNTLRMISNYI